jgi:diguanylate cyclase (GGDEF)-like protein
MFNHFLLWCHTLVAVLTVPPTEQTQRVRRMLSGLGLLTACSFLLLLPGHFPDAQTHVQLAPLWLGVQIGRTLVLLGVSVGLARLYPWHAPSPRDQRVGQILTTLCLIATITFGTFMWLDAGLYQSVITALAYATLLVQVAQVWWLARYGAVRHAALLCLVGCLLVVFATSGQPGVLHDLTLVLGYTVLILIGGLLVRWWLGLMLAAVLPLTHVGVQLAALVPGPINLTWTLAAVVLLSAIAGIVALYTRSLEQALGLADARAADLAAAHADLAHVVAAQDQRIAQATAQLMYQAHHDALTALPNRAQFLAHLDTALAQAQQHPLAVLFLDLDGFKGINDTCGHAVGDACLVVIAQRLRACLRDGDVVARLGGDEFTMLLLNQVTPDVAMDIARRILAAVEAPMVVLGQTVAVSTSIGVVLHHGEPRRADDLIHAADQAMYQAKQTGKAQYILGRG